MPTLYIVATPIGNLQDITLRALEILKRVSVVYAEDTRVTRKLFERHEIATPLKSYHQHSGTKVMREIREALEGGDVALVTDAGTPGIADPGNELIDEITNNKLQIANLKIVPLPGPSAVTAVASVCGFSTSQFMFMGYVPKKKGRQKYFQRIVASDCTVIFYETPHRIVKTLMELKEIVGAHGHTPSRGGEHRSPLQASDVYGRRVVVCRELTKMHESVYRGTIEEVFEQVKKDPVKGEYVIVIEGK